MHETLQLLRKANKQQLGFNCKFCRTLNAFCLGSPLQARLLQPQRLL